MPNPGSNYPFPDPPPPIVCVKVVGGVPHALIAGNWYAMSSVTDEATLDALTAVGEQAGQETQQAT